MEAAIQQKSVYEMKTLLLSNAYEPIKPITWKRAIRLLTLNKAEVIEEYDGFVRSATLVIKIPAVVRLLRAFKRFKKAVKFSRASIYARDGFRCQYCGKKEKTEDLTYDHVIPRSQGGTSVFENILTACYPCNFKKGGRTPKQAGMVPLSKPVRPEWIPAITIELGGSVPDMWRTYLYFTTEIDP